MVSEQKVYVSKSAEEIGKDSIDSITDDPFFTYGWFRTLETRQSHNVSPLYLAVNDGNRLVALAPCSIESLGPTQFITALPKNLNRIGFKLRVLRCQSPCGARTTILLGKNLDEKTIFALLAKKIDGICRKQKIMFSYFPYVSQFDRFLTENLQAHGYSKRLPNVTSFFLDVQWNSFHDYLESLHHKVRKNVKREIRKCFESKVTIEESQDGDIQAAKLSELCSNLCLKYGVREKVFDTYFFRELNEHAKDKTKIFIARKNNEIVGFCLTLWQREILDVVTVGFNYDVLTRSDFTYFNVAYYTPVKWAIEHGIRKIYYHALAEKVKLDRGCTPETTYNFVKYHNQLLGAVMGKVLHPLYDRTVLQRLFRGAR
jgi:predicted N-acyltransferase